MGEESQNKNILELSHDKAKVFFLKGTSYCNFELPPYFKFESLLTNLSGYLNGRKINKFYKTESIKDESGKDKSITNKPDKFENVNYQLLGNKDGHYSWRPYQLINPALYIALVNFITEAENWDSIKNRFKEFQNQYRIDCLSIPVVSESKNSDKAETINQWWQNLEQTSLELALDFEYILHTDISDCYGSIYTHSIPWALHGKEEAKKEHRRNKLVGNFIDGIIRDMLYGQTNGIPQGSTLMDFIAEIVLGYADELLFQKIELIDDVKILRYRDDYRIFSNNPQTLDTVAKHLSEILSELGMKLNASKTFTSNDVISASIKPDKSYWILNKRTAWTFQKKLFLLYQTALKYPNSGTLVKELNDILRQLEKVKEFKENKVACVSILTEIIAKNPKVYPVASAILSKLVSYETDSVESVNLLKKVFKKLDKVPNTGILDLWLQRITLNLPEFSFNESLTKLVKGEACKIWELGWLNDALKKIIEETKIVDEEMLGKMKSVIPSSEVELFKIHDS